MKSKRDGTLDANRAITRTRAAKIREELDFEVIEAAVDPHAGAPRRPVRTTREAPTDRAARPPQHFRFFDLPPELRNRVYDNFTHLFRSSRGSRRKFLHHYALISPDTVEITGGVKNIPGIIHVSHQTLAETLALFLFHNHFTFICEDADFSPLLRFMRALFIVSNTAALKLFGPLTIFCHGLIFPSQEWNLPFSAPDLEDWQFWERNLEQLRATGLTPEQLHWLAWLPVKQDGGRTLGWDEFEPGEAGAIKFIFFNYFLEPLMKELRYFSPTASPLSAAVYKQVKEEWKDLGLEADAASEMETYLDTYCHDRRDIYIMRQADLIHERNGLVDEVIDKAWESLPAEPLASALHELVAFDLRHGAAIHRDPARTIRLHSSVVAKAKQKGEPLSPESTVITQVQMSSGVDDEGDEEAMLLRESDAALDAMQLFKEREMGWAVQDYVESEDLKL